MCLSVKDLGGAFGLGSRGLRRRLYGFRVQAFRVLVFDFGVRVLGLGAPAGTMPTA